MQICLIPWKYIEMFWNEQNRTSWVTRFLGQILNNTIFASLSIIFNVNHLSTQIPSGIRSGTSGEECWCLPETKDCLFVWLLIPSRLRWYPNMIRLCHRRITRPHPKYWCSIVILPIILHVFGQQRYLYNTPNSESWFWLIFLSKPIDDPFEPMSSFEPKLQKPLGK